MDPTPLKYSSKWRSESKLGIKTKKTLMREEESKNVLDVMSLKRKVTLERDIKNINSNKGQSLNFVINKCGLNNAEKNDDIIQDKLSKAMEMIKKLDNKDDSK